MAKNIIASNKKTIWIVSIVIIVLLGLALLGGAGYKNYMTQKQKARSSQEQEVVDKIAQLLKLPDETPIFMTVFNQKDFENNDLFRKVQTGDKILVYLNSKQAIIYRPSTNEVVEVLPVKAEVRTK